MKKNIKFRGLKALLAGCLLSALVIPLAAVPNPNPDECDFFDEFGGGNNGGNQQRPCFTAGSSLNAPRYWDVQNQQWVYVYEYYVSCDPCDQYVLGVPGDSGSCLP